MKINPRIPFDNTKKKQEIYDGARREIEQFIRNYLCYSSQPCCMWIQYYL